MIVWSTQQKQRSKDIDCPFLQVDDENSEVFRKQLRSQCEYRFILEKEKTKHRLTFRSFVLTFTFFGNK